MQFSNYADFRTAVLKMIDGDEVSTTFSIDTLDLLIALGESRVYNGIEAAPGVMGIGGLRASTMQQALTGTVSANAVAIPDRCLDLEIVWFDPTKPLDAMSESDLRAKDRRGGDVREYAQAGESLIFSPAASDGSAIGGRFYARPADIKTGGLNATFNRYPEVFMFGALMEAAPFLGEDARIPVWEKLFRSWLTSANRTERTRVAAGSRLTQKVR